MRSFYSHNRNILHSHIDNKIITTQTQEMEKTIETITKPQHRRQRPTLPYQILQYKSAPRRSHNHKQAQGETRWGITANIFISFQFPYKISTKIKRRIELSRSSIKITSSENGRTSLSKYIFADLPLGRSTDFQLNTQ